MIEEPLYRSRRTLKSLWHEYRIYADRVELETGLGPMKLPFEQIERCEVSPPTVTPEGLRLALHPSRMGIKLDCADLAEHILLDRDTGLFRRVAFTPNDPAAFREALEEAMRQHRRNTGR